MTDELKPCSFCKSQNIKLVTSAFGMGNQAAVACQDCSAGIGWFDTEEEARKAWNTRPIEFRLEGQLEEAHRDKDTLTQANTELLVACEAAAVELKQMFRIAAIYGSDAPFYPVLDQLRAAIAKTKGDA
jgi:hypothetical protein